MAARNPWRGLMVGCPGSEFETDTFPKSENMLTVGAKLIGDYTNYNDPVVSGIFKLTSRIFTISS
jgi:hypothetical protein